MATETLVQTVRTTGQETTRQVRDVAPQIALLEPSRYPLTRLLLAAGKTVRKVKNPKFEVFELRRPSEVGTVQATVNGTTTATTITVDAGEYWMENDVARNVTTGEVMLVTTVSGDDITVVRAVGGDIATINSGHTLLRIGNAQPENSSRPGLLSRDTEAVYNYVQIQRRGWGLSQTQAETEMYGEEQETTRKREAAIEHYVDQEKQHWFGKRDIRQSTTYPQRFAGGVMYFLGAAGSGAAVDASVGTLSFNDLVTWSEDLFRYDSDEKMVFCGSRAMSAFTQVAKGNGTINLEPRDNAFGLAIRRFITPHGELNLVKVPLFSYTGHTGLAVALSMKNVRLAYQGAGMTRKMANVEDKGTDGYQHNWRTASGLDLRLPETHGYLDGVTGGS